MSTYLYLECADHEPPLRSADEVGQHLEDLTDIRANLRNRERILALPEATWGPDEYGWDRWSPEPWEGDDMRGKLEQWRYATYWFFRQHPHCRLRIRDEYGETHSLEES